jgi:hypothetical protein
LGGFKKKKKKGRRQVAERRETWGLCLVGIGKGKGSKKQRKGWCGGGGGKGFWVLIAVWPHLSGFCASINICSRSSPTIFLLFFFCFIFWAYYSSTLSLPY